MARPLRILLSGGWYYVTARGNRRKSLFYDDRDRQGFLGLVAELPEQFGLEVHAFVLMDNHYHLLVRTPGPTSVKQCSRSMSAAVRHGRYRLAEVVRRNDGLKYPAATQAVRRFGERLAGDPDMKRFVESLRRHLGEATKVE